MSDGTDYSKGILSNALAGALAVKEANGLWYSDKEVHLDGYTFNDCRFDNCKLNVSNAQNINLINCFIGEGTNFVFSQGALSAIKLFNCKTEWYYKNSPSWVPERDDRGRITLKSNYFSGLAGLLEGSNG